MLSVCFIGLDQALEGCHARVILTAIPLKCEWNPFVVGFVVDVVCLMSLIFLCCSGMLGPRQNKASTGTEKNEGV